MLNYEYNDQQDKNNVGFECNANELDENKYELNYMIQKCLEYL